MALGDVGIFLPAESHYKTPGAYSEMLAAEARKVASYLAEMDMFYENLEEAQRQFDTTLAFKEETRDLELTFGREKLEAEVEMHGESLAAEKAWRSRWLDIEESKAAVAARGEEPIKLGGTTEKDWFDLYGRSLERQAETAEKAVSSVVGAFGTSEEGAARSRGSGEVVYNPGEEIESWYFGGLPDYGTYKKWREAGGEF